MRIIPSRSCNRSLRSTAALGAAMRCPSRRCRSRAASSGNAFGSPTSSGRTNATSVTSCIPRPLLLKPLARPPPRPAAQRAERSNCCSAASARSPPARPRPPATSCTHSAKHRAKRLATRPPRPREIGVAEPDLALSQRDDRVPARTQHGGDRVAPPTLEQRQDRPAGADPERSVVAPCASALRSTHSS